MTVLMSTPPEMPLPDAFRALEALIYDNDPLAIPSDMDTLRATFSTNNAWFDVPGNVSLCLCVPGQCRVALFRPAGLELDGQRAAFFGFWEGVQGSTDAQVEMFEHAKRWCQQHGVTALYGPVNFSTYGDYRVRTHTSARWMRPFVGEPYNPGYYGSLLEAVGFVRDQGYVTQLSDQATLHKVVSKKAVFLEQLSAQGFVISSMAHDDWLSRLDDLHGMIDDIFGGNFAYTPLSLETFKQACGPSFIQKADPEASVMVMAPNGELAGFFLMYPDYGPIVVRGAGDARVEVGELSFEKHAQMAWDAGSDTAIFKTVGVQPKYRKMRLMDAMIVHVILNARPEYKTFMGALIREDNPSRNFAREAHLDERGYHLYRMEV